jgi:hemerythrin HHE cation binding domain-containing protein
MAAPSMSMNKVIHCAVRRDLSRFKTALEQFSDGDRARAAALQRAWQNFDAQLTDHHEGEHEIAWDGLKAVGVDQATIDGFDHEHELMAADLATTRAAMAKFAASASRADADAAGAAMAKLETTTNSHLEHEEATSEPLYQKEYDHPAIKEMGKKFSRRVGPAKAGVFFAWVQDGASAEELSAIRQSVPGPVLAIMGGLFGRSYRHQVAPVWR